MILSNVIKISQEELNETIEGKNKGGTLRGEIEAKLGLKFLNLGSAKASVEGNYQKETSERTKMLASFEVKATKSVILNEVIDHCKTLKDARSFTDFKEGALILINNVSLELENETELRTAKLISNGLLQGMQIPEIQGLDINNMFNSIFKDYSYMLKGSLEDRVDKVIVKIPMTFENEFESSYNVDDLFIGKVSLLGIYKGQVQSNKLGSTFKYLSNLENKSESEFEDDTIIPSQHIIEKAEISQQVESDNPTMHFVDLLSIIQTLDLDEVQKSE